MTHDVKLIPALLVLVLLVVAPTSARAACGVPSSRASYEDSQVQVYTRDIDLLACVRATGEERRIGQTYDEGESSRETSFRGLLGGGWAWTSVGEFGPDQDDEFHAETVLDLRSDDSVSVDNASSAERLVLPGAIVTAGPG